MGRVPAERSTTYSKMKLFDDNENPIDPLDEVENPQERFGSYQELIRLKDYRFRDFYQSQKRS
jgi:hypothetical protein